MAVVEPLADHRRVIAQRLPTRDSVSDDLHPGTRSHGCGGGAPRRRRAAVELDVTRHEVEQVQPAMQSEEIAAATQ
eukprot:NODE_19234_length_853_cov_4.526171.p6 GENE.NODE_19234_length_853_cov_4.526171~~NODE_19234_length_853_cov_4.526171.p6  ORF type:complete len:76 (-),score=16.42 NODE_19234_length_853_cov_4.526171:49-276(-)